MGWEGRARRALHKVHQKSASNEGQKKKYAWLKFSKGGPLQHIDAAGRLAAYWRVRERTMAAAAPLVVSLFLGCSDFAYDIVLL